MEDQFKNMKDCFDNRFSKIDSDNKEIISQLKVTNGRIRKLEAFKFLVTGALVIINLVLVPILLMAVAKLFL